MQNFLQEGKPTSSSDKIHTSSSIIKRTMCDKKEVGMYSILERVWGKAMHLLYKRVFKRSQVLDSR